jgi:hypothetical protein
MAPIASRFFWRGGWKRGPKSKSGSPACYCTSRQGCRATLLRRFSASKSWIATKLMEGSCPNRRVKRPLFRDRNAGCCGRRAARATAGDGVYRRGMGSRLCSGMRHQGRNEPLAGRLDAPASGCCEPGRTVKGRPYRSGPFRRSPRLQNLNAWGLARARGGGGWQKIVRTSPMRGNSASSSRSNPS